MIIFIRHGETVSNAAGIAQGNGTDTSLTGLGKLQAKKTGEFLKSKQQELKISQMYSSSSARALETAKIIATELGIDNKNIIQSDLLVEGESGPEVVGTTYEQRVAIEQKKFDQKFMEEKKFLESKINDPFDKAIIYDRFIKSFDYYKKSYQSETDEEIAVRVNKFFKQYPPTGNILIISHNGTISATIQNICGVKYDSYEFIKKIEDPNGKTKFEKNCHITIMTNKFELLLPRYNLHLI
jgi:broad specificity phosphatase PhoE